MKRLTNQQLGETELRLTARDREILTTFQKLRYIKTGQVQRLFFPINRSPKTALSNARLALKKLNRYGLLDHLPKQIGGAKFGSQALIWHLTEAGMRLLDLGKERNGKRQRYLEPSRAFVRHTLAVTECFVQITEICRMGRDMDVKRLEVEPECWRSFEKNGKTVSLRPDLFAETVCGRFTDRWFIEMDLDTESVNDIVEKCRRYQQYHQTNLEQEHDHVFPIVLWIVPSEERKEKMTDAIRFNFGSRYPQFHCIITPNELWTVMTEGVKKEDLC